MQIQENKLRVKLSYFQMLLLTNVDKMFHLWLMFYCVILIKMNCQNVAMLLTIPELMSTVT